MNRFVAKPAVREQAPLLVGLFGPSGGGKTYSALRLATGMVRESGGEIYVIDTESRRSSHYADAFKFKRVDFGGDIAGGFSPANYVEAIEYCVADGARVVIVDSGSHAWEGPGGVLEMHDKEVQRLAKAWNTNPSSVNFPAWAEPKKKYARLVQTVLRLRAHFIFCFRAKQKTKPSKGSGKKELNALGWQPIAGGDFIYEFGISALLPPGANGHPDWAPREDAARAVVKYPDWAKELVPKNAVLSEDMGAALAKWAGGTVAAPTTDTSVLLEALQHCDTLEDLEALEGQRRGVWDRCSREQKAELKAAANAARLRADAKSSGAAEPA